MLNHTTFDLELDEEIRVKTLAGTLTPDEKAWIATYNSMWSIMGDLGGAIRKEYGLEALETKPSATRPEKWKSPSRGQSG